MSKKSTKEDFLNKLEERHPGQFELIGEFKSLTDITKFKCKCGNIFDCKPELLLYKNRIGCKECCYKIRKQPNRMNKELFLQKLKEFYPNDEYIMVGEFIDYETETSFKHKCGGIVELKPHVTVGTSAPFKYCKYCNPIKKRSIEEIRKNVESDGEYKLLSKEYKTNKDKLEFLHTKCNGIFEMTYNRFQSGNRCPICNGHQRYPKKDYEKTFNENNADYEMVTEYISLSRPITIKHKKCGNTFELKEARQALPSCKCRYCHEQGSRGEILIKEWLEKNNIKYEREKKFKECFNKYLLRFDFYLPEYEVLIEFDGEEHYKRSFSLTPSEFKEQQKRDEIKNNFVRESKKYTLIRINYKQNPVPILEDIFINEKDLDDLNITYIFNE